MNELKKKADGLGVEYNDDTDQEALETLITEREEELSTDVEHLSGKIDFLEGESKKAYAKRDTALSDKRKLSQKIKELEESKSGDIDSEEFKSIKTELEDLKKFKEDAEAIVEAKNLETLTGAERDALHWKKQTEAFESKLQNAERDAEEERTNSTKILEDARKQISSLRTHGLEAEIVRAALKNKAWNAEQIVNLTRSFFTYDEQLDKYTHLERDERNKIVDELSVGDYIKNFLGEEENENLVKGELKKSFETQKQQSEGKKFVKKDDLEYDPKDPKIIEDAEERGLEVSDWIDIKIMEDKKQQEIRSQKA